MPLVAHAESPSIAELDESGHLIGCVKIFLIYQPIGWSDIEGCLYE
jgi:hypothetical protein